MADLTLEDIARLAGVSRSTVSRVVNEHPNVSADVRKRVLEVIRTTGFHPNLAARTLASNRSWMLGLVLPRTVSGFFADPYFPRLTQGIAQACNDHNYTLALFLVTTKEDEERIFPRVSRKGFLDGVLVQSAAIGDQLIDRLAETSIPMVVAGRPFHAENISYIDVDNVAASRNAMDHLIRLGYRRIAHIGGSPNSPVTLDRKEGYMQALREAGRAVDPALIVDSDFSEGSGYQAMRQLLTMGVDAVFTASDILAIGGMRAVREAGLRVPQDVAFVGFDDLPLTSPIGLGLTTVRQPVYPFGYKAIETLIDVINNGILPPRRVIMDTELIIRESCGAPQER
ncbi:transcriptional regulator, LacI family [Longilinea arvoryzae]|uniref:Transcriptional regulator, LacI family n=1 Tax=Longilinea arvoryzae TaxID=360412 RepID=A0A0S7B6Q6_9CHLR|nr:LacI family DNA-binding transcriptional regulator [Longilinea arvoryzae]GAP12622.1 transcriptional regulator, LacI family [Longilinea arvoryzae]